MRRLTAIMIAVASSCSVQTSSGDGPPSTSTTVAEVSSTTIEAVDPSSAVVLIGPARYELEAICAAGGAGEVEVSVAGQDVNGLRVVGYIRAFLGEPYVSIQVGDGDEAVLFEPRLEGVLPFELTDRGVRFSDVEFVTELELETGEFVAAGVGSVEVECGSYVRELPPVPFESAPSE